MSSENSDKKDGEQILLFLNDAQKVMVHVRSSTILNQSMDVTGLKPNDDADRPDPLRLPEVIIVICVLLLWCGSIFIFIRHSELLRIRHRDLPFRPSLKPPMNLNHVTIVRRTSDMVIHSKPRFTTATLVLSGPKEDFSRHDRQLSWKKAIEKHSFDSNASSTKNGETHDQLLDPQLISSDVRRRLLDLHRKSMENLAAIRYSISYSASDVSKHPTNNDVYLTVDERCVQESPV